MNKIEQRYAKFVGSNFGKLTVTSLNKERSSDRSTRWDCLCECGGTTTVRLDHLKNGHVKSCGCLSFKHGLHDHPLYKVWEGVKARCCNPNHKHYSYYGGRGVTLCDEWLNVPEKFIIWALGNGYTEGLSLDRKDNSQGYSPENCRVITQQQNSCNRRGNLGRTLPKGIRFDGYSYSYEMWHKGIRYRKGSFKTVEEALEVLKPLREKLHGEFAHH